MNIAILIKPVPSNLIKSDSNKPYMINPYDLYALKQISKLKDDLNIKLIAFIMGRENKRVISEVKYNGADEVIMLSDDIYAGSDTFATANILYTAIKNYNDIRLVICGDHAIDGETGHVGAAIARKLGFYYIRDVVSLSSADNSLLCVTRSSGFEREYKILDNCFLSFNEPDLNDVVLPMNLLRRVDNVVYTLLNNTDLNVDPSLCGKTGSRTAVIRVRSFDNDSSRNRILLDSNEPQSYSKIVQMMKEVL